MKPRRLTSLALCLALMARAACAGEVLLIGPEETPDPRRIAEILSADGRPAPAVRMRSLRLLDATEAEPAAPAAAARAAQRAHDSFALSVQFSFDSARIASDATAQLDAVAEGIRLAAPAAVVIEGHTDAAGSHEYNVMLSLKRAMAVKRYLVRAHGIPAESLKAVGMGKSVPLNRGNPHAPENRRVEFRAELA